MVNNLFKNKPVTILSFLSAFLFVSSIGSCINSNIQGLARKKEMAQRMDVEERIIKLAQEKNVLLEKLKAQEKTAEEERVAFQATKQGLLQEQLVCQALRDELQKVTKLKESLEADLKKTLKDSKRVNR